MEYPIYTYDEIPYWEELATSRSYVRYRSDIERSAIVQALPSAPASTTALEIGCEGGRWSKLLSDLGWQMICTDIDQKALALCQQRVPSARCILVRREDARFPCDTESVGLAICIEVPPVVHADWFVDEAFRVLQPGGVFVGVAWNRISWRGLNDYTRRREYWYWWGVSYQDLRKRLCTRGFTMLHELGFAWPPFKNTGNSPLVPVAASIERYLGLRKLVSLSPLVVFVAKKT